MIQEHHPCVSSGTRPEGGSLPTNTRNPIRKGPRTLATALPQVLLLALLVLLVAGCAQAQSPPSAEKEQPSKQPRDQGAEKQVAEKKSEPVSGKLEHPALGEKDAPVVMVEYSDYQ